MTYLIIDLVLICIALGIISRSWKEGLVSSVVRLVGAIASYAGAWILSRPLAVMIYDKLLEAKLIEYAEGLIPPDLQKMADGFAAIGGDTKMLEGLGLGIGNIGEMVAGQLDTMLSELGLDNLPFNLVDTDKVGGEVADRVLDQGMSIAEALTQALLQPLAITVLRIICFAVVFGILSMLVALIYRIGFGFNHIPLVGGLNHLLGGVVGVLQSCIVVYIICMVIAILSAVLGGKFELLNWNNMEQSKILNYVVGLNPPSWLSML